MYAPPTFDIASKMFLLLALPRTHAGHVGCSLKYILMSCLCLTLLLSFLTTQGSEPHSSKWLVPGL